MLGDDTRFAFWLNIVGYLQLYINHGVLGDNISMLGNNMIYLPSLHAKLWVLSLGIIWHCEEQTREPASHLI